VNGRDQDVVAEQGGSQAAPAGGPAVRAGASGREGFEGLAPTSLGGSRPFTDPVGSPSQAEKIFARLREAAPELAAGVSLPIDEVPVPTAEIAPPAIAERLPPLALPVEEGTPSPAVAATMAWAGAQAEAAVPDDDLDLLAAKIKRILDEEARRYGIDV
jgi:hypothetical protein